MTRLSPAQQFALTNSLRELLLAVRDCRDGLLDPSLQPWSPAKWDPPRIHHSYGEWIEYYLGDAENRGRVIVCFDKEEDAVYLVARTAIHDHDSLRELVARFSPKKTLKPGSPSD